MRNIVCIDGIRYYLNKETKKATVLTSGNKEEKYQGEMVIPKVVVYEGEKYIVTEIENWAFSYCSGLTNITIPESVTKIGNSAFYGCSGLTSITIPESVTKIEDFAFMVVFRNPKQPKLFRNNRL